MLTVCFRFNGLTSINAQSNSWPSSVTSLMTCRRATRIALTNSSARRNPSSATSPREQGAGQAQICSKHYKIARGSAMECAASLDVMRLRKVVAPERYERGIRLLEAVVSMLTKMF